MEDRVKAFTVYYNEATGELTRVDWTPGFQNQGVLLRADVLKDARNAIGAAYEEARQFLVAELGRGTTQSSTECER